MTIIEGRWYRVGCSFHMVADQPQVGCPNIRNTVSTCRAALLVALDWLARIGRDKESLRLLYLLVLLALMLDCFPCLLVAYCLLALLEFSSVTTSSVTSSPASSLHQFLVQRTLDKPSPRASLLYAGLIEIRGAGLFCLRNKWNAGQARTPAISPGKIF